MPGIGALPAIALVAGSVCGLFTNCVAAVMATALAFVAAVAWTSWLLRLERTATVAVVVAFGCAGAALAADAEQRALHPSVAVFRDPVPVRMRLLEDASVQSDVTTLRAEVTEARMRGTWHRANGGVILTVGGVARPDLASEWRAGRSVEAFTTLRRPARYFDNGVPDFERDLALSGTSRFGSIKSALLVDVRHRGTRIEEVAAKIRAHVRRSIARWVEPHGAVSAGIATAVLIGDRTGLPDDVRARLQAAGTYHVIAISGGNIAILAALVLGVLALCGIGGRPAACLTLLMLIAYAVVVSSGASVWRATLMVSFYLGARLVDHRTPAWQALAVAAAIMICARPLDVRDVGFILTFGATAALLEGGRRVARLSTRRRLPALLVGSIAASMAVEAALLPVSAWSFSRVTSAGLVLNMAAVPLMAVVQVSAIVVSSGLDVVADPAGWIAHMAAAGLIDSARLVDVVPWLAARVPPPPLAIVIAYYLGMAAALRWSGKIRCYGLALVAASATAIVTGQPAGWLTSTSNAGRLDVTMFDVGQGDATLVELPNRSRLLVDAGGIPFGSATFDIGGRVLAPALWARGVRRLDSLLITHGDPDHIGGALAVIDDFGPSQVWEGVPVGRHRPLQDVLERAAATGVRLRRRQAGDAWSAGDARIRVLHPPAPDWERPHVRNDDSVILEIAYGNVAILLLGDAGGDVERSILSQLTPAAHRILKVGHHGSRTSTSPELLQHWRPHIALISCGRDNPFGHPAPEVVRRLHSIGARIFRTDLHGQVTIETDGRVVKVRPYGGSST